MVNWGALASVIAEVVTAATALFLLFRDQVARRSESRVRRRQHADRLVVFRETVASEGDAEFPHAPRDMLRLRNESARTLLIAQVSAVIEQRSSEVRDRGEWHLESWPVLFPRSRGAVNGPLSLAPGQEMQLALDDSDQCEALAWAGFFIVDFVDSSAVKWRKRSDNQCLCEEGVATNGRQRITQQILRRIDPLGHFIRLFDECSKAALQRRPERRSTPWSALLVRWLWGYHPGGEDDEWLRPEGAPEWWCLQEIREAARRK